MDMSRSSVIASAPYFPTLTLIRIITVNRANGVNSHDTLASGQVQGVDKDEGESDDEKDEAGDAGVGGANGGKAILCEGDVNII